MVDNRSAGFFGIGGAFNFKSGDISGTAAKTQDDKMGQGTEYFAQEQYQEEPQQSGEFFVDRSAQLRATLNSLAMMNVASVLNEKKRTEFLESELKEKSKDEEQKKEKEELDEEFLNDFDEDDDEDEESEYY